MLKLIYNVGNKKRFLFMRKFEMHSVNVINKLKLKHLNKFIVNECY